MPIRKIPKYGAQKNIGKFSSVKTGRVAWYESLLERDYMYLLDFDPMSLFGTSNPFGFASRMWTRLIGIRQTWRFIEIPRSK